MRALMTTILAALSYGWCSTAAADFVIDVPVRVVDLHPSVPGGRIDCEVRSGPSAPEGNGSADFTLTRGSFSGTVSVSIKPMSIASHLEKATSYNCTLGLFVPQGPKGELYLQNADASDEKSPMFHESIRRRPGSAFTPRLSGAIGR